MPGRDGATVCVTVCEVGAGVGVRVTICYAHEPHSAVRTNIFSVL